MWLRTKFAQKVSSRVGAWVGDGLPVSHMHHCISKGPNVPIEVCLNGVELGWWAEQVIGAKACSWPELVE